MRAAKIAGGVIAILLTAIFAFEAYAVWRAKLRTPAVLAEAAKGALKLSDLPKRRINMLVKVEDPAFYRHRGVDFSTPGSGMTTITQSLVKHFYFEHFRPGFPKIEQTLIARFVLDPAMPKDAQLAAFLNSSPFGTFNGRRVIGFDDAARTFYGRPLDELSDHEFLSLDAMLIAPNRLDPIRHRQANEERVRRIEAMLAGKCRPGGLRDIHYEACAAFAR